MKIFFFFLFFSLIIPSCDFQGSSTVEVRVNHHKGGFVTSSLPILLNVRPSRRYTCRHRPFEFDKAWGYLSKSDRFSGNKDVRKHFFRNEGEAQSGGDDEEGGSEGSSEEGSGNASSETSSNEPIYTSLEGVYTEFGLHILNRSKYILLIHEIQWEAVPNRNDLSIHHGDFDASSYCSGGETPPWVYFVPPAGGSGDLGIKWEPGSENPFNNLTLYIDGLDRVEGFSDQQNQGGGEGGEGSGNPGGAGDVINQTASTNESATGSSGGGGEGGGSGSRKIKGRDFIPNYTITLKLLGHFVTDQNEDVGPPFEKYVVFEAQPPQF